LPPAAIVRIRAHALFDPLRHLRTRLSSADAAALLAGGGIVIHPTTGLVGLAADPRRPDAIARLAALKGRDGSKPFLLVAADFVQALLVAAFDDPAARLLATRLWPGPLTIVATPTSRVPPALIGLTGGVAVRVDPHPGARALAQELGFPFVSTSANVTGTPPPCRFDDMDPSLFEHIEGVFECPPVPTGVASTIVTFEQGRMRLLREGALPRETLERALEPGGLP